MTAHPAQIKIPAVYYRGGTSKGVFFKLGDLPAAAQQAGEARDKILLRVLGSPDPYGKQIDGLGNASSSTSKAVILDKSSRPGHDVDYLFGQVSIDKPFVDWSGNCGNLTAAVGAFAIANGLVDSAKIPENGLCTVRIWQKNINKTIIAHVPVSNGEVQESGDFELDGVTFPAAEVQIEFLDPADGEGDMFPTGNLVDELDVPGIGRLKATLINSGIPTVFVNAADIGYTGTELQDDINNDAGALAKLEAIRAHGYTVAAGGNGGVAGEKTHGVGVDVFKFGGYGGTLCQFVQGGFVVECGAQMAVGNCGGGGVGVGVEYGNAVAHGFGGCGKHQAELSAAENAEHGGR